MMNFMWFSNLILFEEILCTLVYYHWHMFVGSRTTRQLQFPLKWPLLFDPLQCPLVDKSQGEHSIFFKTAKMLKNQTFPKSCGEHSKKISSFEELLHGKFLFLSQLETKSQFGHIT